MDTYNVIVEKLKTIHAAVQNYTSAVTIFHNRNNPRQMGELKKELDSCTSQELAKIQNALKVFKEDVEETSKNINELYDYIRKNRLPTAMENEDLNSFAVTELGKVTIQSDIYLALPAANKQEFYDWLDENEYGDLIKEEVNHNTLKAWVKSYMQKDPKAEGYVPLPEYLKITPYSFTKITKAAVKAAK